VECGPMASSKLFMVAVCLRHKLGLNGYLKMRAIGVIGLVTGQMLADSRPALASGQKRPEQ